MAVECTVCKERVEIVKVEEYPDYRRRHYTCGHSNRLFQRTINEPAIRIQDNISSLLVTRFKQLTDVAIKESTEHIKFVINNSIVNINLPDGKVAGRFSAAHPYILKLLDFIPWILKRLGLD